MFTDRRRRVDEGTKLNARKAWKNRFKEKRVFIEGKFAKIYEEKNAVDTDDGKQTSTRLKMLIDYFDTKRSKRFEVRKLRWKGGSSDMRCIRWIAKSDAKGIAKGKKAYLWATFPNTETPQFGDFFKSMRFAGTKDSILKAMEKEEEEKVKKSR
jgi:hypothetical protein